MQQTNHYGAYGESYDPSAYAMTQSSSDFVEGDLTKMQGYPAYPGPYMPMPYGYNPYAYNYGNYYERKSFAPYKKKYNKTYTTTQRIYTKKPKQVPQTAEGAAGATDAGHSPNGKQASDVAVLPQNIQNAKFFVIKSYSEEDVHKAIKHNVWCSTKEGNVKLHDAFVEAEGKYPIFLLFSVNSSGYFVGVAEMKSHVDFEKNFEGWNQSHKWKGVFKISWMYIKDIPNKELRHFKNDYNEGKPVPNSRDSQEVPTEVGLQVLDFFEKFRNQTSILDDYEFYEMQQQQQQQQQQGAKN